MINQLTTLSLIGCLFLVGCKAENDVTPSEPLQAENYLFYSNLKKYNAAVSARVDNPGNPFTIKKVDAVKDSDPYGHDILEIRVSHYCGCSQDFDMIWDGKIMESFPEQVNIFLHLNGTCADDREIVERVLRLDLNEFVGHDDLVGRATFHLLNGSVASTENDQTVSTSP